MVVVKKIENPYATTILHTLFTFATTTTTHSTGAPSREEEIRKLAIRKLLFLRLILDSTHFLNILKRKYDAIDNITFNIVTTNPYMYL